MGYSVNKMKERAEELAEGYEEAYNEAFNDAFKDMFYNSGTLIALTEDDIQGFLDSFTFPDEGDWAFEQVQSELDEIGDQRMEEERDRRMGL